MAKNNADSYDGLSYQSQTTNMATFKSSQSMGGGETGEDDVGAVPLDTLKRDTAFDVYVQQQQQQQQQQQFKATANDGLVSRDGTERGTASEFGWQGAAATVPSTSGPAGNVISDSLPRVQSPEPANNMQQESAGNDDSSRRVSVAAVGGGAFRSDSIASTLSTPYTPTMALDYDSPYQQGQGSGIQPQPSRTPSIVLSSGTVASGMPVIGGGGSHPGGVGMSIGRTGSAASMRAYVGVAGSGEGSGLVSVPEGAEGDDDDRNVVQGTEARRGDQRALLDDDYA